METMARGTKNVAAGTRLSCAVAELTVAAGVTHALIDFAAARGADRDRLHESSGIHSQHLLDLDSRIPLKKHVVLLRTAAKLCNDPALALHFGETIDLAEFSVVGLINSTAETLVDAMTQLNRYGRLVAEFDGGLERFSLKRDVCGLWLVDARENPNEDFELTEAAFARLICGPRRLGITQSAKAVHVTHEAPCYQDEYERVYGAPVTFESHWNAILLDEKWLTYRIARQPHYVFGILSRHADALLKKLADSKTTRGSVESLLFPILHTGDTKMTMIARKMGVSRQTLFRRLKAEGVTYELVLDELRHKLAVQYLGGKKVSVNQTAYLVGFSDAGTFSRAFKRWTGSRPKAWRATP